MLIAVDLDDTAFESSKWVREAMIRKFPVLKDIYKAVQNSPEYDLEDYLYVKGYLTREEHDYSEDLWKSQAYINPDNMLNGFQDWYNNYKQFTNIIFVTAAPESERRTKAVRDMFGQELIYNKLKWEEKADVYIDDSVYNARKLQEYLPSARVFVPSAWHNATTYVTQYNATRISDFYDRELINYINEMKAKV